VKARVTGTGMRNTILTWLWAALLLIVVSAAEAQQPKQIHRIGFLFGATRSADSERLKAFRQGLRGRGYVEEKNILIEQRYAEGNFDRLPALAADLVQLKVNIIVSATSTGTRFLKEATNTFPLS